MTIGFSDGQQFESRMDQFANSYHNELGDQVSSLEQEPKDDQEMYERAAKDIKRGELKIDREHHVPLVASAIVGSDGSMAGLAIDHRVPSNPEYESFLALHERTELAHMNNLVQVGMKPQDAYHEAHDKIATPTETAAVRAHAARNGQDPDEYLDKYKQFWREAATIAAEDSDKSRHPLAHTTLYALDEAELGKKYAMMLPPGEDTEIPGADAPGLYQKPFGYGYSGTGKAVPNIAETSKPANENLDAAGQARMREIDDIVKAARKRDLIQRTRRMEIQSDPNRKSTTDQLREWFLGPDK